MGKTRLIKNMKTLPFLKKRIRKIHMAATQNIMHFHRLIEHFGTPSDSQDKNKNKLKTHIYIITSYMCTKTKLVDIMMTDKVICTNSVTAVLCWALLGSICQ